MNLLISVFAVYLSSHAYVDHSLLLPFHPRLLPLFWPKSYDAFTGDSPKRNRFLPPPRKVTFFALCAFLFALVPHANRD